MNPEALKDYGEALSGKITELEQEIYSEAGCEFNINSPKQLGEILFEKMGLPGGKKTKTGYSTAADVLEKLSGEYPVVKHILEYRGLTKLSPPMQTVWLHILRMKTGYIRPLTRRLRQPEESVPQNRIYRIS